MAHDRPSVASGKGRPLLNPPTSCPYDLGDNAGQSWFVPPPTWPAKNLQVGGQDEPTTGMSEYRDCADSSVGRGVMRTRWLGKQPLLWALVLLGLALRSYHYLRDRNVWHDEAAMLVNVIPHGFQ